MKKDKIVYWIATGLIFLFEGVLPVLTSRSQMAIQGITHLGYPVYFVTLLIVFKVLGGIALILPMVPKRIKEWAYVGYGFDFICAFVSIWVVDGFGGALILPVVAIIILKISYYYWHKLQGHTFSDLWK